jgi:hypothetical protein
MELPEGHYWSEAVRTDDPFWSGARSSLVAFVGIGPGFSPQHLGTGFIIGTDKEGLLLVLTAKHVVEDGAIRVQRVNGRRAPSAPGILFDTEKPKIGPMDFRAVWMGAKDADMFFVRHVAYANNLDVALCVLEAQERLRSSIHQLAPAIALDTRIPPTGTSIHIIALSWLKFNDTSQSADGNRIWRVETRPVVRVGKVLSHQDEGVGHKGPCFTTTIPTDRGMSGGFGYVPRDANPVAACGIISTSPQEDDGKIDFQVSGNSTLVGVLGALALQVPLSSEPSFSLLFALVKSGQVRDIAGGGQNLGIRKLGEDGECEVYRIGEG